MPTKSTRQLFTEEILRPKGEVDLARAALLVAREEYPQLPVDHYLATLDLLAMEVQDRLSNESAPLLVLQSMTAYLFRERKFRGNSDAYYDPRNSLLSDVLERGLGIPLTLGMLMLEVGWRLDLPLEGVNFPGHFLIRFNGEEVRLLADPFDGGRLYFEDEAQVLLDRIYGGMVQVQPRFLKAASRRDMLVRLLTNLKGIYTRVNDYPRALAAIERILALRPTSKGEIRDRGVVLAKLGRSQEALEYLETYLTFHPDATDAGRVGALVAKLKTQHP